MSRALQLLPAIFGLSMLLAGAEPAPSRNMRLIQGAKRPDLASAIEPWLGTRHRRGRAEQGSGTDCSGFVREVMKTSYALELPRTSRELFKRGWAVKRKDLRTGDLVFFSTGRTDRINHVGIYMGDGTFAHASESRGVVYDELRAFPGKYRGARRVIGAKSSRNRAG